MTTANIYTVLVLVAILAVIAARLFAKLRKNARGAKYSLRSILFLPVLYSAITFFLMIGMPIRGDTLLAVSLIVGIVIGLVLGMRAEIFEKDGKVMYRRSAFVMAIWLIGFVIRVGLEFISGVYLPACETKKSCCVYIWHYPLAEARLYLFIIKDPFKFRHDDACRGCRYSIYYRVKRGVLRLYVRSLQSPGLFSGHGI